MFEQIPKLMASPSPSTRNTELATWLASVPKDLGIDIQTLTPASSDASFRRYYRVMASPGTLIVMDAPPPFEDCRPFIDVAQRLLAVGLNVPQILASNTDKGFLLLTDLGRQTYYDRIQQGMGEAELQQRYRSTLDALVSLQKAETNGLADFDEHRLLMELQIFIEWYLNVHHEVQLSDNEAQSLQDIFALLARHVASEPHVLVHRDFHSPNLMICESDPAGPPGVIDFQDAVNGAISYDIASLVFDARTTWEEAQQLDWAIRYWEKARKAGLPVPEDFAQFHMQYEWTGLQRNLRILGVFARLNHRDGKAHYLDHIPRVLTYVRQVAQRYKPFFPLLRLLDRIEGIEHKAAYTF